MIHLPRDSSQNAISDEMFRIQPFSININRHAITGGDSKSKGVIQVDESRLYSKFLNDKFFYEETYDQDYGNQKMRRINIEGLFLNVVTIEFLCSHLINAWTNILENMKKTEELGVLRTPFEEAHARSSEVLAKYSGVRVPLCIERYLNQTKLSLKNL